MAQRADRLKRQLRCEALGDEGAEFGVEQLQGLGAQTARGGDDEGAVAVALDGVAVGERAADEPLARSRAAVAAGEPGRAMRIFSREVLRLPAPVAWLAGAYVALRKPYRDLVPRQIDDMKAIHDLGIRLDAYAAIPTPVLLLRGERSPALARERNDALAAVLPDAEQAVLPGRPHDANRTAPDAVATRIEGFYRRLLDG